MMPESPLRECLEGSEDSPSDTRACIPGYMLRRLSCAVWKLASEQELLSEGRRLAIEGRCLGILLYWTNLTAVSVVLASWDRDVRLKVQK